MAILTDRFIQKVTPPDRGRKLVFDRHKGSPAGFGIRVSPAGKVAFVFRYSASGKDRLLTIGTYGTWSLAAARKRASELKRQTDGGADILESRRQEREAETVQVVVQSFYRLHSDRLKSAANVRSVLDMHILPVLGKTKVADVRRKDVIAIVEELANRHPRQAALVLTHFKQVMAWCEDREIITVSPIASLRANKISKRMVAKPRSRVLTEAEIKTLWTAREVPGMHTATLRALRFILATGQRPGEVCNATRTEVQGNVWTIPAAHRGKTGDDHRVPLTKSALALIEQAAGEVYLFERYRGQGMDVNALSHAVRDCYETLGDDPGNRWRPHDLRRTMRTGLAAAGVSEVVAELTVGHVRKGIAAVYDQYRYDDEKRLAMERWERRLLRTTTGETAKVVDIREARA